jgi:tRNA threonylcarbamoyladenosine biosynthesis protein TsaE
MIEVRTTSLAGTQAVAAAIARLAQAGDIIVLAGEMGAGKTAFAQGFGAALGVVEPITSPTFNLVHSYPLDHVALHHADVYRLSTQHELDDLALDDLADDRGIVLVEWGDVVAAAFGDHLTVHLVAPADESNDEVAADADGFGLDGARQITISAVGPSWAARWDALRAAVCSC